MHHQKIIALTIFIYLYRMITLYTALCFPGFHGGIVEIPRHFFPDRSVAARSPEHDDDDAPAAEDWTMRWWLDVTVVPYCPIATKVSVVPIVAADYDIIRQNVHWLEQGGLLSQVSVIALHQVLHISVVNDNAKTTIIRLRVQDLHTPFPSPCCRLVDTSELIVLTPPPSTESTSEEYDGLLLNRIPCRQDVIDSVEMAILAQCLEEEEGDISTLSSSRWIHLPQKTVVIHRLQRNDDTNGGGPPRIAMLRRHDRTTFVRVLGSAHVPHGCIGTFFFRSSFCVWVF
jgi:hypothetical protein